MDCEGLRAWGAAAGVMHAADRCELQWAEWSDKQVTRNIYANMLPELSFSEEEEEEGEEGEKILI